MASRSTSHGRRRVAWRNATRAKDVRGARTRCRGTDVRARSAPQRRWFSVVIPTYNRLPILRKCLCALEEQEFCARADESDHVAGYEVVVVDDGSTDGTVEYLRANAHDYPHLRLVEAKHGGAASARNRGVLDARGDVVVFIDSDLVVEPDFLRAHARGLATAVQEGGDDLAFTYGRVINTDNFEDPTTEPFKTTDRSAAFFATGNVAIPKHLLLDAPVLAQSKTADGGAVDPARGPFDTDFTEYGWEDLELGERLRTKGVRIQHCPEAVGYHWHPALRPEDVPKLVEQERQRGRGGARFYLKHPNWRVRLMVQLTPFHMALWFLLTLGGALNERVLGWMVRKLCDKGRPRAAAFLLSPILNWHCVVAAHQELRLLRDAATVHS